MILRRKYILLMATWLLIAGSWHGAAAQAASGDMVSGQVRGGEARVRLMVVEAVDESNDPRRFVLRPTTQVVTTAGGRFTFSGLTRYQAAGRASVQQPLFRGWGIQVEGKVCGNILVRPPAQSTLNTCEAHWIIWSDDNPTLQATDGVIFSIEGSNRAATSGQAQPGRARQPTATILAIAPIVPTSLPARSTATQQVAALPTAAPTATNTVGDAASVPTAIVTRSVSVTTEPEPHGQVPTPGNVAESFPVAASTLTATVGPVLIDTDVERAGQEGATGRNWPGGLMGDDQATVTSVAEPTSTSLPAGAQRRPTQADPTPIGRANASTQAVPAVTPSTSWLEYWPLALIALGVLGLVAASIGIAKQVSSRRAARRRQQQANAPTMQFQRPPASDNLGDDGMTDVLVGEEQPGAALPGTAIQ